MTERGLTPEQVEGLAKGRIWTGAQAQERGLVDELGGLERAIALARSLAPIESSKPVRVTVYPRDRGLPIRRGKDSSEPIRQAVAAVVDVIESLGHTESVVRARLPLIRF
jgi:protease-4